MLPSGKFSRFALAVPCLLTGLLIFFVAAAPEDSGLAVDLLQSAVAVLAGICAIRVTRASMGYLRRLWLLFTISVFLACGAQILKIYYKHIVHLPFASPWPSDILFILWVIPALMMFLPRSDDESRGIDWPAILDFVQVGIVALTAYLYFFYLTSRWQAEGTQMVLNVFRVQLFRDVVVAAAFMIGSWAISLQPVRTLFRGVALFFLLEAGWAVLAVSSSTPGKTNWDDVVWCAPYLFLTAFASKWKTKEPAEAHQTTPPIKATLFSRVLPVCIPLLVLWMSRRIAHEQVTLAWAAITVSFLVSTARLILTNETQRRISDSLRRTEKALRVSEERFRTLVQDLHIGIVLLGPNAETLFANRSVLETFGVRNEEVAGKSSAQFEATAIREDGTEMPFAERPAPRAIATKQPVYGEVVGWRRGESNDVLWTLVDALPQINQQGEVANVILSISDISKRKEAEEALHQLSARLLRLQDEERRRLGRELHDSLAQSVMAVNLDLAQVTRSPVPLDKRARHALSEARKVLREMSREIRTLSYLLHPPVLDELGLASAVKEYAHGFSERSGIALEIDVQPDFPRMPQEAETAFFRIVQESLANIQKHSGSSTGTIRLWDGEGRVQLEIRDQGRGMSTKSGKNGGGLPKGFRLGVGILGMRERMAQLGGTLEVQSSASGTAVHATIPLAPEGTHGAPSHPRGR